MNADLQDLGRRLVGRWTTEATHPGLPGAFVRGSSEIQWLEDEGWEMAMDRHSPAGSFASPDAPFSQRMTFTFEDEDRTMSGKAKLSYDNVNWDDDLEITYRRAL
jgi:hypothetical protein